MSAAMVDFDAVIRHFGPSGVSLQQSEAIGDDSALKALADPNLRSRRDHIRQWLQSYGVFRVPGIGPQRDGIAAAILDWADSRVVERDVTTAEALAAAHRELMRAVCKAYTPPKPSKNERDFSSLASKALWLCYPSSVPLFDGYAKRALWVISKLEADIICLPRNQPDHHQFVHVWKALYSKHIRAVEALDLGGYPYRVRIFDKILWLIGRPQYGNS